MARLLPDLLIAFRRGVAALTATSLVLATWPARSQTDGAAEARTLAPTLLPDPDRLFDLQNGKATLQTGDEIPLDQLFPGAGDPSGLTGTYGNEGATIDMGHAAQIELESQATQTGEAYRTVTGSPWDQPMDLSTEPFFDHTRSILGDIDRLGGQYGRCIPITTVGSNSRTVYQPDPRVCTRSADVGSSGTCRLEHRVDLTETSDTARVAAFGKIINTFRLDLANGTWQHVAPSDGTSFAAQVPKLDQAALCSTGQSLQIKIANLGTWPGAPIQGEIDDSIEVRTLQAPSCANDLTAIVQLFDAGGPGEYKMTARLGLDIVQGRESWYPSACLDIANGSGRYAACIRSATMVKGPDAGGCAELDGRKVCQGDGLWAAISPPPFDTGETHVSRLATAADIAWRCPSGTAPVEIADGCGELRGRAECRLQKTDCVAGTLNADNQCTVVEDTYDCGHAVEIDDGSPHTELQCDGEVRCLGNSCTGTTGGQNLSFAKVAATLKGAELAALDGACSPATGQCTLFSGKPASCKKVLNGTVDCCKDVQGVSLANYLQLAFAVGALGGAMATLDPTSPLRGAWEMIGSPAAASWNWIGSTFTSSLNGVTGSTTPMATSEAATSLLGVTQQTLMQQTAQWTLDTFGPAAANALFTVNGGAAVAADGTLAAGTLQLGGLAAAAGTALTWVAIAYTTYQAALILAQIIWACEEDELDLAVQRELKQCTHLGSYCAKDTPFGCLESRRSYCCFASPISRILQEQIRPQLGEDFGTAEHPNCAGLDLTDLGKVDWSKVDLDEWIAMLVENGQLPDAESITIERLTGMERQIAAAYPGDAGINAAAGERPNVRDRTIARMDQVDVPGALTLADRELEPYLKPGAGLPKPILEAAANAEDLPLWRLPNVWVENRPPNDGSLEPSPPAPPPPPSCTGGLTANVTPATFKSALSSFGPGEALILAPGAYPGFGLANKAFGGAVIQCAEPGACRVGNSFLAGVSGLAIDGLYFKGGNIGISINQTSDITVRCSTFFEQQGTGILAVNDTGNLNIQGNTFSDDRLGCSSLNPSECDHKDDGSVLPYQDYGMRLHRIHDISITDNNFSSRRGPSIYSHDISLKERVGSALIADNFFNTCGRLCIEVGQEATTTASGDISCNQAEITRNSFNNVQDPEANVVVLVKNIHTLVYRGNAFNNVTVPKMRLHTFAEVPSSPKGQKPGQLLHGGVPTDRAVIGAGP